MSHPRIPGTRREQGPGLTEYVLILALIATVALVALAFVGSQLSVIASHVGSAI